MHLVKSGWRLYLKSNMVMFFFGTDTWQLRQASQGVIEKYRQKHRSGLNFISVDLAESEPRILEDAVKTISFFDEVRLAIVRNAFINARTSDWLINAIQNYKLLAAKEVVVFVIENQDKAALIKKDKKLFTLLSARGFLVKEFEPLEDTRLNNWIKREIARRGCSIEPPAIRLLVSKVGKDSWALINEVEKLSSFKKGGMINISDVESLVLKDVETNIFNFIDALANKDKARAFSLLYKEIASGRDPYYILSMIVYQFRNLLAVKDLSSRSLAPSLLAKKAQLHPFVLRKTLQSAKRFTDEELSQRFNKLLTIDTGAKLGRLDLVDALYTFVLA